MSDYKEKRRKRRKEIMDEIAKVEIDAIKGGELDERRLRELGGELDKLAEEKKEDFYPERKDGEKLTVTYFKMAEENGIGVNTFKYRFYQLGWSAEKAASKPVKRIANIKESGITKEIYLHEKRKFATDEMIARNFNISIRALETFKRVNSLNRKYRKQRGEFDQ